VSRRSADPIELSEDERRELEAIAGRLTAPFRMVQRARIVLYAAQGLTNVEIARRLDTAPEVVAKWRRRFRLERLEGLQDRARSGRPRRFSPAASGAGQSGRVRVAARSGRPAVALLAR
jgi:DNA-directed RNA polymerase specialized sigma24 family protein